MTTNPPPPSAGQSKKTRWGNLNMGIAKTHRLATQLVGIQLSGANLLALMVSAASVVAGTVSLVAERYPENWPLLLSAGVIGLGLALLIEGLTLGSLIRIRLANRAIRAIEAHLEGELRESLATLVVPDLAHPNGRQALRRYRQMRRLLQQEYRHKRQQATRLPRQQRRFSVPLATMGALCSAIAGGLFYHTILAGLGPVESLVLAILFPLVVTGTFVSSEMHKEAQEEAIKEGFGGGALTETAIRAETKLTSALAVHAQVLAYLEKPEAEQAIEEGARNLLTDILAELRAFSRHVTRQVIITEEQGDDTIRQLGAPQKRGDKMAEEGKATGDTTAPASAKQDNTALTEKATGDTTMPISSKQDDTILAEKATGDMTAPPSAKGRERSDTSSSDANVTGDPNVAEPGKEGDEQDPAMRQLLAYLAEHPHAKQAEVAEALGMAVRTIQRKLAAWKRQQPGASPE
ncbi:MAG TPA: hypothetical protein VFV38_16210 [Ktedonobacteraceae bacterium]|nr:hypothetical protein [Ktedonobacteraceae bacterium]